jgi:(p)ppGpp synthase/HD superfamily hydrolase
MDIKLLTEIVAGVIAAVAGGVFIKCAFCGRPIEGDYDVGEFNSGRGSHGVHEECARNLRKEAARRVRY